MQIFSTPQAMQQAAILLKKSGQRIGMVPTMGYLHEGHLSLMELAHRHADYIVVSIFVNPTQFGPNEDFGAYPRDFERDETLCRRARADAVFYPAPADMYLQDHSVYVVEEKLGHGLCGASRPGHFRGVCTVVAKLFNLALPDVAVFGEKDAQQLRTIERMVRDLNFPVRMVRGPTVREPDGLALSSRNKYLSEAERPQAVCLRRALDRAEELYRGGEREAAVVHADMERILAAAPAARVDYIELVDDATLEPVKRLDRDTLVALAVFIGKTRLIDNTVLRAP